MIGVLFLLTAFVEIKSMGRERRLEMEMDFFSCMPVWSRLENLLFSVAPLQSGCGLLEH